MKLIFVTGASALALAAIPPPALAQHAGHQMPPTAPAPAPADHGGHGDHSTMVAASALYAREIAPGLKFTGTLAWGRKSIEHDGEWQNDDAYVAEMGLKRGDWTLFSRGEMTENRELLESEDEEHGPAFRVGKISLGAVRDFRIAEHFRSVPADW